MENKRVLFEIAPQPSAFTMSLLKLIYARGGPVDQVYKKYKMEYRAVYFLEMVDGFLYIDKEKERKAVPGSFRNVWYSGKISTDNYQELHKKLQEKLDTKIRAGEVGEAILRLIDDYAVIFEINLLFEKAIKGLELALPKEDKQLLPRLLAQGHDLLKIDKAIEIEANEEDWRGNSLEVGDEGKFQKIKMGGQKCDGVLKSWWNKLPSFRQKYNEKYVRAALSWSALREGGRWLAVKDVSLIRKLLQEKAQEHHFRDLDHIFNLGIEELLNNEIVEKEEQAKKANGGWQTITQERLTGVSPGIGEGKLVTRETIGDQKNCILYTEVLAPELTELLEKVEGVVASQGSMLSHLAIVGREMGKPMVVNFQPGGAIKLGDRIRIDGNLGRVQKI